MTAAKRQAPRSHRPGSPGTPREFIDQSEYLMRLAFGATILEEVIRPDEIVMHGSDRHCSRPPRRRKRRRCLGRFKPQFLLRSPLQEAQG
jgi:hypothetical protein